MCMCIYSFPILSIFLEQSSFLMLPWYTLTNIITFYVCTNTILRNTNVEQICRLYMCAGFGPLLDFAEPMSHAWLLYFIWLEKNQKDENDMACKNLNVCVCKGNPTGTKPFLLMYLRASLCCNCRILRLWHRHLLSKSCPEKANWLLLRMPYQKQSHFQLTDVSFSRSETWSTCAHADILIWQPPWFKEGKWLDHILKDQI